MGAILLTPDDLAIRWGIPINTLSKWRWNGQGPIFLKMGKHVRYHLQDIEAFESQKRRLSTSSQSNLYHYVKN